MTLFLQITFTAVFGPRIKLRTRTLVFRARMAHEGSKIVRSAQEYELLKVNIARDSECTVSDEQSGIVSSDTRFQLTFQV